LICTADEHRFGLFENDIARIKRYSDKALHNLGNGGEEYDIRSFRDYLSIPEDMDSAKPILIRPHEGRDLLTVDSIYKKRRVKTYNIFPTRFDYIKEVLVDDERIPVFELQDLLKLNPPLESEALESVKNGVELKQDDDMQVRTGEGIDQPPSMEKEHLHAEKGDGDGARKRVRAAKHGGGFTFVLLSLSFAMLIALGIFIYHSENLDVLRPVINPISAASAHTPNHVLPYLSHQSKLQVQQNVYELLQKDKARLKETEKALLALETEKNSFTRNMEERDTVFDEHVSVFDIDESNKELKSVVDFVRNKVTFKGEIKRRSDHFFQLYETRRDSLLAVKEELEQQIEQLTALIHEIETSSSNEVALNSQSLFVDEAKAKQMNRFVFLLERGDYDGALKTLERTTSLPYEEEEHALHLLARRLLVVLNDYGKKMVFLDENRPFEDIKLAYLNEDYGAALRKVQPLKEEEYLRPLLGGIESGLYENMEIERQIEANIVLRKQVDALSNRAAQLEENGEYVKAVDTFESILILPLPSYDREYILKRIHSLWLEVELRRLKREENTKAIKYLESARILNREGNEKGAIDYYKMLLIECPHSDFVGDAVDEIMKLRTM